MKKLWWMWFHPIILLHHFERFVDVKFFRPQEPQEKSFILSSPLTQITTFDQFSKLLHFRIRRTVFVQFLFCLVAPTFVWRLFWINQNCVISIGNDMTWLPKFLFNSVSNSACGSVEKICRGLFVGEFNLLIFVSHFWVDFYSIWLCWVALNGRRFLCNKCILKFLIITEWRTTFISSLNMRREIFKQFHLKACCPFSSTKRKFTFVERFPAEIYYLSCFVCGAIL